MKKENIIPKIKISENTDKITTPHFKKVYRLFDKDGMAIADQICIHDEDVDFSKPLEIFDPESIWKKKMLVDYTANELLIPIFKEGELVYDIPSLEHVREYCLQQIDTLWEEVKRFSNPHIYYVDLSKRLWDVKQEMIHRSY